MLLQRNINFMRNWVIFEGKPNGTDRGKMRITINHKRDILLNEKAFETIGRPKSVELCYDRKYGIIGLRALNTAPKNAFPLIPCLGSKYRLIHAAPFCKHFKIEIDRTLLFTDPNLDKSGILELDLAQTQQATRGTK
jgi:hypothetical protein